MKKIITFIILSFIIPYCVQGVFSQGTIGQYPGSGLGFDSGCGYLNAGNSDPGVSDTGLAGNVCGSAFDVSFGPWTETSTGFDITGFNLNNYDIDQEAVYGIRLFFGAQDNCSTICFDLMINLAQNVSCGTFGPQANLSSFGFPVPSQFGNDIFGDDLISYTTMCPNTEYFAQYQFILATAVDLTDPDGNSCAMDDALITNTGTMSTTQTLVAPGTRDAIVINSASLAPSAVVDCPASDLMFDFTVDVTSGCSASSAQFSKGLEVELRANLSCMDGTSLDIGTGPLINDATLCIVGISGANELDTQISLGSAEDLCAIFTCDPNASLDVYVRHTFCEADDILGDGSGIDEAIMSISIASALSAFNIANEDNVCACNDICSGAIPITFINPAGTGCGLPTVLSFSGMTDSGQDNSCGGNFTGIDQFFSWTATSAGLNFDGVDDRAAPVITVWTSDCSTEIDCRFSDGLLSGWAVGDDLIIQISKNNSIDESDIEFCLEEPEIPANDICDGAISLVLGSGFCAGTTLSSNNTVASDSGETPVPSCGDYEGSDQWFLLTVPASGNVTIETYQNGENDFQDSAMSAYSGNCNGALVEIGCDADGSDPNNAGIFSLLELTGLTAGNTIYIRVWEFGNDANGDFLICAWDPCPPNLDLTNSQSMNIAYESGGYISSDQTIVSPAQVDYNATTEITLLENFEVKSGALFHAFIDGCGTL